jgi:ankyrin repeat protein
LVAAGVDVNAVGKAGTTPLLWAMAAHSHDGFVRLLEQGADPNRQHREASRGGGSCVTSIAARNELDPFYLAAVLKHGGDPNIVEVAGSIGDKEVHTVAIHMAVDSRRTENLELLIHAGADINRKGGIFGQTPLVHAAGTVWYEGVYYLLQAGADYTIADDTGSTVADYVVDEPHPFTAEVRSWKDKVLDLLEKKGVDLESARRKAEAKGIRTKKWEPGEEYKPKIQEFRGPQYPGYGN